MPVLNPRPAHYLTLVGLPLLAVVGVLHAGRDLRPPGTLAGDWMLRAPLAPAHATACAMPSADLSEPMMTIVQSGARVVCTLRRGATTRLSGWIEGSHLVAEGAGRDGTLRLTADVRDDGSERVLLGTFAMPAVAGCPALHFTAVAPAVRRPPAAPRH